MTSPATPTLDENMDAVKKKEKTHNEETSSQPQSQESEALHFEDYLFPPPPTPSQTNKPSKKPGRPCCLKCAPATRDYTLHLAPAEVEKLDYQPLSVDNLDHGAFHGDADPSCAQAKPASTVPERRSRKRGKAEFKDVEAEVDHSDDNAEGNGGAWSPDGGLNFDISEDSRFDADEVFNHMQSDDIESGILAPEALPTNWDGFQPELEEVERLSFPGVQEFGIAQSREDDFNSAWFRNGQGYEYGRQKRDVPDGLIHLARTSTRTNWRQDEDAGVGATKYQNDAAYHACMRQALSSVKPESTISPSTGESRRMADGDSVTKSLKAAEKVEKSTERWMKESRPQKRIRRSGAGKLESTLGELVAE